MPPGMTAAGPPKVVLLGMTSHMPVGGNVWLVGHYAEGFRRLGYDVYYAEAHGLNPSMLMRSPAVCSGSGTVPPWTFTIRAAAS